MKIGVFYFATDYSISPGELAQELEQRGFDSLFLSEHTHIPVSRRTPFPRGDMLPRDYASSHDLFVGLSFAAAVTTTLKLGTAICLVPQHDPIVTAKAVASLDVLSGGRFVFGIGGGWNAEEMENHGHKFESRFKLLRERVLAMQELWTKEEAEFHGDFVDFDPVWINPKPVQKPHPPILLGGESIHTLRRVVEFCDGWMPRTNKADDDQQTASVAADPVEFVSRLRTVADEMGRSMASLSLTAFRLPPDRALIDAYTDAGFSGALLYLPSAGRDEILRVLDSYAPLLR
tara:strand:- start:3113 stop:3979 length:867 start_codon:yes stop_codon:yes gene_type:complete